jgi:serine/threonine-protein kinase RIO1
MPNDPYLDAGVVWRLKSGTLDLHEAGYHTTIEAIRSSSLATEVTGLISTGKEADVYLAGFNGAPIAMKAYRLYRTSHRGGRPIKQDSTGWLAAQEYETTRQAWKGGARVPAPARRVENMFSMRYLGDEDGPAPRLQDVKLEDAEGFLDKVVASVEALAKASVVHPDLSAYNMLIHQGNHWFIDLSEAIRVDSSNTSPWQRLNEVTAAHDHAHFKKYGKGLEIESFASRTVGLLDKFGVLD